MRLLSALSAFFQSFCYIFALKLLYALQVSFLPTFFHLSKVIFCHHSHLGAVCYFLTFSETTVFFQTLFQSLRHCKASLGLSQPLHFLPGLSKTALAAFQAFRLFLSHTEATSEHFQSFCSFFFIIFIPHFSEVNWVFLGCFSLSKVHGISAATLSPGTGQGGSL